jgi:3-oxoadipate enol-lactonase
MEMVNIENGLELAYVESGKGETIVLLHGFCGDSSYWERMIPTLSKEHHVLSIDLRGHGQSTLPDGSFSIDDMAADIAAFLEKKINKKVFLFGHSLGGYITLAFAERYDEKLKAFGLIHSTAFPDSEDAKKGRDDARKKIENEGTIDFINKLVPKLFSDSFISGNPEVVQSTKEIGYKTNPEGAKETLIAMKDRKDRNHILSKSSVPILLVAGKEDKVIPPEKVFSVEGNQVTKALMEMSGHMSMFEETEQLISTISSFVHQHKNG